MATRKKTTRSKTTTKAKAKTTRRTTTAKRKTTKRATTAKRTTAKRAPAKSRTAAKKKVAGAAIREPMTQSQLFAEIAEQAGITKKEVKEVFTSLSEVIERHVKQRAAGMFKLPGLLKIVVQRKKATKSRKGINPFTGEETIFKAKPARNVVKVRALKSLKDMVN